MYKLFGASVIIAAFTYGGFQFAKSYSERPQQLRGFQQALKMLETEIFYGAVPLHIAMKNIGERQKGVIKRFFIAVSNNLIELDGASAYECWNKALDDHYKLMYLKAQDKAILIQFGHTLGVSDKEDQIKHLHMAIQNLAAEEMLARDEQKINEKLSKNMGVLLGILLVILIY